MNEICHVYQAYTSKEVSIALGRNLVQLDLDQTTQVSRSPNSQCQLYNLKPFATLKGRASRLKPMTPHYASSHLSKEP